MQPTPTPESHTQDIDLDLDLDPQTKYSRLSQKDLHTQDQEGEKETRSDRRRG